MGTRRGYTGLGEEDRPRIRSPWFDVDSGYNIGRVPRKSRRRTMSFVVLTFRFEQEEDGWFGKCVELGTAT